MEQSFYIGAYWGARAEPMHEVVRKVLQTLNMLSHTDVYFSEWYEFGYSRNEAMQKKILLQNDCIEKICLSNVKKGELDDKGYTKLGFTIGLWSGHLDEESSSISFIIGSGSKWVGNSCVLKIPSEGSGRESLLQSDKSVKIINNLVEILDPDYSVLTSHELREHFNLNNEVGWITYRKSMKKISEKMSDINYQLLKNGYVFSIGSGDYDIDKYTNEFMRLKLSIGRM